MKFRNIETGEVRDNIAAVLYTAGFGNPHAYIRRDVVERFANRAKKYPAALAQVLGYEIIDDGKETNVPTKKDETMEENKKPRICEVLGVDVGEKFRVVDDSARYNSALLEITDKGNIKFKGSVGDVAASICVIHAINHPESIVRIPNISKTEIEGLQWLQKQGACWLSRDMDSMRIQCWPAKVYADDNGHFQNFNFLPIADVKSLLFPFVEPGDCLCIADILADCEKHLDKQ